MADLDRNSQASMANKIINEDETNIAEVNDKKEVLVEDVPQQGISTTLTLNTTPQELKVGVTALVGRKYIEMEALGKNIQWGYDISCPFKLQKAKFYSLPAGESCTVYLKTTQGSSDIAVAEK